LNTSKIDPSGPSPESFQKQLYELNQKLQGVEGQLKETKNEYKEYKIENDGNKRDAKKYEEENTQLKAEVARLTATNQKLFSDMMESRKQLQVNSQSTHEIVTKLQIDFDDLNVAFQKANNSEVQHVSQIKDCKKVLKALKNKIIEVEGIVRDFRLFEKQVNLENHKNQKLLEEKTREVERV
jgi:chromosome segregation ATPase